MKTSILTFALSLIFVIGAAAQTKDLKGPAYKNKKAWENPKPATTIAMKQGESLKGPGVKALLPLERKTGELFTFTLEATPNTLKGPAYKNKKAWEDSAETQSPSEELLAKE